MAPEGGVRRKWQGQKPLIFMRFHEVSLGNQHKIWSKQHNGKVRIMDFGSLEVQAVYISGNVRHLFYRNTAKVALSTLFTRIEQSWRLYSSVKFVGLCIARSSSVPETCNHSQGEFSAIAPKQLK